MHRFSPAEPVLEAFDTKKVGRIFKMALFHLISLVIFTVFG